MLDYLLREERRLVFVQSCRSNTDSSVNSLQLCDVTHNNPDTGTDTGTGTDPLRSHYLTWSGRL